MKRRWMIPLAFLLLFHLHAAVPDVSGRVATITINPGEITTLHLRPGFESTIRMPEEVTSVVIGSPGEFKAEHNEGESRYVYVKPITKQSAQSNLLISTRSGQRVDLKLVSDGANTNSSVPVDFLIEYRASHSFFDSSPSVPPINGIKTAANTDPHTLEGLLSSSALDEELAIQKGLNAPSWTKWDGKQIQTSIGDIREWSNETIIAYSIFNSSDEPVEIVPPQIQVTGLKPAKKDKKKAKGIIADQLEIRDFKLSTTRLEPGARADGVVEFDRPNFKQSTEKLYLQLAQADEVDRPILICLPFTPPLTTAQK
jgi:hypothetical protein